MLCVLLYCYVSMNVVVSDATVEKLPNQTATLTLLLTLTQSLQLEESGQLWFRHSAV